MNHIIEQALSTIHHKGTLLYPTDTVWGLGCDATCGEAVDKIIQLKGRSDNQSFILLVHSAELISHYVKQVPEIAYSLIEMSETPLTIIYPDARSASFFTNGLAQQVIAKDNSVAIRVVRHPFCIALLQKFCKPIVSTSANFTGQPAPASFTSIDPKLIQQVDYCVDPAYESPSTGKPSSIVKLALNGEVQIIRP